MKLNLLTGSSPGYSRTQSAASLVNYFLEKSPDPGLSEIYAIPTPGITSQTDLSGAVVRHLLEYKGSLYVVVDANVYKIDTSWTATLLGTLATSSGRVDAAAGANYIMWVDGTAGKSYQISSGTFATISDAQFIDTATSCCFLDGYFFTNDPDTTTTSGSFYISDLNDPTSWAGLTEAASTDGDPLIAIRSDSKYLALFGPQTTEFWSNTGAGTIGFTRQRGLTQSVGCAAQHSIARATDGGYYLLASSKTGQGQVVYINPLSKEPVVTISTPAIHHEFGSYSTISDAFAYVYEKSGHQFYILTFPTENKTWVWDKQTGLWHERTSYLPSIDPESPYTRSRVNCYAFFNNKHLIGDLISGKIGYLDEDTYTEFDETILREIRTSPLYVDSELISLYDIEIEMEKGPGGLTGEAVDPEIQLRVSKDGGFTYGNWYTRSAGAAGDYKARVRFSRLGQARSYVFEIRISDPIKCTICSVAADVEISKSRPQ